MSSRTSSASNSDSNSEETKESTSTRNRPASSNSNSRPPRRDSAGSSSKPKGRRERSRSDSSDSSSGGWDGSRKKHQHRPSSSGAGSNSSHQPTSAAAVSGSSSSNSATKGAKSGDGTSKRSSKLKVSLESIAIQLGPISTTVNLADPSAAYRLLLEKDVDHLNGSPSVQHRAGCSSASGQDLLVRVAVDVSALEPDLLASCGIDATKVVLIQLAFKNGHCALVFSSLLAAIVLRKSLTALLWRTDMKNIPQSNAKTLLVRQLARPSNGTTVDRGCLSEKDLPTLNEFGLWWTLEQRLSEWFAGLWKGFEKDADELAEKFTKLLAKASSKASDLLEMFELPMSQLPLVVYALKKSKDDETAAMQMLLDESQRSALETAAMKEMTHGVASSGFLDKVAAKVIELINESPKVRRPLLLSGSLCCAAPCLSRSLLDPPATDVFDSVLSHLW